MSCDETEPSMQKPESGSANESKRPVRQLTAAEIFAGSKEVIIEHAGQRYRLRITRSGKLILTK